MVINLAAFQASSAFSSTLRELYSHESIVSKGRGRARKRKNAMPWRKKAWSSGDAASGADAGEAGRGVARSPWSFEPEWDGFHTIVFRDGDEVSWAPVTSGQ
jgi:hypothetical protein